MKNIDKEDFLNLEVSLTKPYVALSKGIVAAQGEQQVLVE